MTTDTPIQRKVFAWQRGLRGPTPVLFHYGIPVDCATGKARDEDIIHVVFLSPDDRRNLKMLERAFPLKQAA